MVQAQQWIRREELAQRESQQEALERLGSLLAVLEMLAAPEKRGSLPAVLQKPGAQVASLAEVQEELGTRVQGVPRAVVAELQESRAQAVQVVPQ